MDHPALRVTQVEPERREMGTFSGDRVRIGKAPECEVRFSGVPGISGVHAILEWRGDRLYLSDPGARHPVQLDGRIIPFKYRVLLPACCRLTLGHVSLQIDVLSATADGLVQR